VCEKGRSASASTKKTPVRKKLSLYKKLRH
jgi:hypothetical protein